MSEKDNKSLLVMHQNLKEEADEINKRINENLAKINEIDEYLRYVFENENQDYKFFSPRDVKNIYKENLDNNKTIKSKLENDNRVLYSRLNKINSYTQCLEEAVNKNNDPMNLKVLDIQEKDRQRIARDLHDTSLQNLAHLVHKIELASLYIDKDKIQAKLELESISLSLRTTIDEIRNTIFDLRPMHFDDFGLKETFEGLFKKLKYNNPTFDIVAEIDYVKCNNEIILLTIYRIVQEACTNAVKHSNGNKVHIKISQNKNICNILIEDNGCGFDLEKVSKQKEKHYGIEILRERVQLLGGDIYYRSVIDKGTEVIISVPLV